MSRSARLSGPLIIQSAGKGRSRYWGNLAPNGAILKTSAASHGLMNHVGMQASLKTMPTCSHALKILICKSPGFSVGAEKLWTEGRAWHAGVGLHPDPG